MELGLEIKQLEDAEIILVSISWMGKGKDGRWDMIHIADTFANNPQYRVTLTDSDPDDEDEVLFNGIIDWNYVFILVVHCNLRCSPEVSSWNETDGIG